MNRIKELKEVNWRELKPLQPDNAKIVFNYQAIENSLKKYGFAQPFFGWEYEGSVYTIDGHTRKEVLNNMENVPETLPCVLVDAKDRKEAIEMLIEVYNQKHNPFDIEVLEEMIEMDELDVDIQSINVKIEPTFDSQPDIDYSILDGEDDLDDKLSEMTDGVKKAIQIEFEAEHYEEASELVKFWREQKLYIGGFLMEKLKAEKDKL